MFLTLFQAESKRNNSFAMIFYGKYQKYRKKKIPERSPEEATSPVGADTPPGRTYKACGLLRGALDATPPPSGPINPETSRKKPRSGVSPPQACVATKNQSGSSSGTLPEGGTHLRWPSSSSRRSPWRGGSSSPSGLRVCTGSYVFDLSLSLSCSWDVCILMYHGICYYIWILWCSSPSPFL